MIYWHYKYTSCYKETWRSEENIQNSITNTTTISNIFVYNMFPYVILIFNSILFLKKNLNLVKKNGTEKTSLTMFL